MRTVKTTIVTAAVAAAIAIPATAAAAATHTYDNAAAPVTAPGNVLSDTPWGP